MTECSDGSIVFRFGDSSENVEEILSLGQVCEKPNDVEMERQMVPSKSSYYVQLDSQLDSSQEESNEDGLRFLDVAKGQQNLDMGSDEFALVQELEPLLKAKDASLDEAMEHRAEEDASAVENLVSDSLKPADGIEPSDAVEKITDEGRSNSITEIPIPSEVELQSTRTTLNSDSLEEITSVVQSNTEVDLRSVSTMLSSDGFEEITHDVQRSNIEVEPAQVSNEAELLSRQTSLNSFQEIANGESESYSNSDNLENTTVADQSSLCKEVTVTSAAESEVTRTLNYDTSEKITDAEQNSNTTELLVSSSAALHFIETTLKSDALEAISIDQQNSDTTDVHNKAELRSSDDHLNSDVLEELIDAEQNNKATELSVSSAPDLQSIGSPLNSDALEEKADSEKETKNTEVTISSAAELQFSTTPSTSDGLQKINDDQLNIDDTGLPIPSATKLQFIDTPLNSDVLDKISNDEQTGFIMEVTATNALELQIVGTSDGLEELSKEQQGSDNTEESQFIATPSNSDDSEDIIHVEQASNNLEEEPVPSGVGLPSTETSFNTDTLGTMIDDEQINNVTEELLSSSDALEEMNYDEQRNNITEDLLSSSDVLEEMTDNEQRNVTTEERISSSDVLEEMTDDEQRNNITEELLSNSDVLEEMTDDEQRNITTEELILSSDVLEEMSDDEQRNNTTEETISSSDVLEEMTDDEQRNNSTEEPISSSDDLEEMADDEQRNNITEELILSSDTLEPMTNDEQKNNITEILASEFVLASSAASLPHPHKELAGGCDIYFVTENWLGVAESIGPWSFEGTKAGLYAYELIESCKRHLLASKSIPLTGPVDLVKRSAEGIESPGSTTILVAYFDGQTLHAANIGDSGFLIIRNGLVFKRSSPMFHEFGFPVRIEKGDDPSELTEEYKIDLYEGDVLITATDGLFDNLYEKEIAYLVSSGLEVGSNPQEIAELLATRSQEVGRTVLGRTPFSDAAQGAGCIGFTGGKMDDVTVIVSVVRKRFTN
ncbi:hypothetical protein ACFE04_003686 [Oxalis oulophora]